jgi:hypothetical protein
MLFIPLSRDGFAVRTRRLRLRARNAQELSADELLTKFGNWDRRCAERNVEVCCNVYGFDTAHISQASDRVAKDVDGAHEQLGLSHSTSTASPLITGWIISVGGGKEADTSSSKQARCRSSNEKWAELFGIGSAV